MKKVHLICNAHIDPIWQWDWHEGVSAVISIGDAKMQLVFGKYEVKTVSFRNGFHECDTLII